MKDGLTQVKELKDKIHEQYIEIQELNKARKFDIEYNKYLQKEIIRLNTIINETKEYLEYQISQLDFYEDTKAKMLGSMAIVLLKGENNE